MKYADSNGGSPTITPRTRPPVRIRRARLSDIRQLVRMYRGQSPESRQLYHPFPFDRFRLNLIFLFMVASRPFLKLLLKISRRRTLVLLVATVGDDPRLVGYGNVAFVDRSFGVKAIFGYLVEAEYRGLGVGTRLHEVMIEAAIALGVRRGGGMVVSENASNLRVLEKLGFEMRQTGLVDTGAPSSTNIETDGDLVAIAARWQNRAAANSVAGPSGSAGG
ncbi:MAG: GNAT family N-acetyltransferase [Thermoplasmata archaeon]|nr:GNAT family N-acetyltransferase [Thermoplasmata archaeon]